MAYDLIGMGLRLRDVGSPEFSWGDLWIVLRQSGRDTALYRAMNPDDHEWTVPALLLAEIADGVNVGNWQRGSGKKRDYPKPIPRPGVVPDAQVYGGKSSALPIDEMAEWLGPDW